ncbi:MAG: sigma-70 family RNA polymerase sigma factor [Roseburia sp.]|nr:sigma-70 family RNA polymerase sigma factor [Roseburia sp.]
MNTGVKRSNEELVKMYQCSGNESYLQELINQNVGLMKSWAMNYAKTLPTWEVEDLMSEAYFPLMRAVKNYKEGDNKFSTLLRACVLQHYNRIYQQATRQKRFTSSAPESFEVLAEVNRDGIADSVFEVECEDFHSVELMQFLDNLELNEKERVAVNVLMDGGTKGDIAKELNITPASVTYYIKSIKNKFISAGFQYAI